MDIRFDIPVEAGNKITRQEFEKKYLKPQKPVILHNLWEQYPAHSKWTMDYFRQIFGDFEVDLFSTKLADPGETLRVPHARMKFREYLDLIEHETTDLRIFLFPVFKYKPDLLKDFGYPAITGSYLKIPFLFFGPKKAVTRMHQDIDLCNVFLTQFAGRRRVVLFAPDQSQLLYKLPFNVHSIADIDHPDYETYPALRYVKGSEVILENGDTLFMPSGYWHHIEYLEAGFGLSVRSLGLNPFTILHGVYNVVLQRKFDDLMRYLGGQKWFEFKKELAYKKAEKAMQKLDVVSYRHIVRQ